MEDGKYLCPDCGVEFEVKNGKCLCCGNEAFDDLCPDCGCENLEKID